MDSYEISLWEDYYDEQDNYYSERKICIIGSDDMSSQARALEPKLVENIIGTNTFTFKIYNKYKDNISGKTIENPYKKLLINERKVKVKWKGKWYDLIIKKIQEISSDNSATYTCQDLFIHELSKNGYDLNFDTEL